MAWTRRTVTFGALASSTSRTVNKPTGTTDGDIVIVAAYREDNTDDLTSGPSGGGTFTEIASEVVNTGSTPDIRLRVWWTIAASEPASYTVTWSTAEFSELIAIAYTEDTGAFPANPIDQTNTGTGNSATPGTTGVTTTVANTMKVLFGVNFDGDAWSNGATGMTERGDGSAFGVFDEEQAAAGASGAEAASIGGAQWAARLLAIKPGEASATYTGTAAVSLPAMTAAGSGTFTAPTYTATAAITLPVLTASGVGAHSEHGTAAISLPVLTASGTGTHTAPTYTGDAAVTLPAMTAEGTGTFTVPTYTGTAAVNLPVMTADGTGAHTAPTYTGSAAISLPVMTASGTGTFSSEYLGDGAATLPAVTASGTGTFTAPTYTGSATITLPALTAAGEGIFASAVYSGTADITLPDLTAAGSGTFTAPTYTGTGAPTLPVLTVAGTGAFTAPTYTGAGAVTLPVLVGAGVGAFTEDGFDAITNPSGAWGADQAGAWSGGQGGAWSGNRKGRWG